MNGFPLCLIVTLEYNNITVAVANCQCLRLRIRSHSCDCTLINHLKPKILGKRASIYHNRVYFTGARPHCYELLAAALFHPLACTCEKVHLALCELFLAFHRDHLPTRIVIVNLAALRRAYDKILRILHHNILDVEAFTLVLPLKYLWLTLTLKDLLGVDDGFRPATLRRVRIDKVLTNSSARQIVHQVRW